MWEAGKIRLEARTWFEMDQCSDASILQAGSQLQKMWPPPSSLPQGHTARSLEESMKEKSIFICIVPNLVRYEETSSLKISEREWKCFSNWIRVGSSMSHQESDLPRWIWGKYFPSTLFFLLFPSVWYPDINKSHLLLSFNALWPCTPVPRCIPWEGALNLCCPFLLLALPPTGTSADEIPEYFVFCSFLDRFPATWTHSSSLGVLLSPVHPCIPLPTRAGCYSGNETQNYIH